MTLHQRCFVLQPMPVRVQSLASGRQKAKR